MLTMMFARGWDSSISSISSITDIDEATDASAYAGGPPDEGQRAAGVVTRQPSANEEGLEDERGWTRVEFDETGVYDLSGERAFSSYARQVLRAAKSEVLVSTAYLVFGLVASDGTATVPVLISQPCETTAANLTADMHSMDRHAWTTLREFQGGCRAGRDIGDPVVIEIPHLHSSLTLYTRSRRGQRVLCGALTQVGATLLDEVPRAALLSAVLVHAVAGHEASMSLVTSSPPLLPSLLFHHCIACTRVEESHRTTQMATAPSRIQWVGDGSPSLDAEYLTRSLRLRRIN